MRCIDFWNACCERRLACANPARLFFLAIIIAAAHAPAVHAQPLLQTLEQIHVGFELKVDEEKGLPFAVYRAGQGIAADGMRFYTSAGALTQDQQIFRYSPFWGANDLVGENEIHADDYAESVGIRHIGDIAVEGEFLYAPLSDYLPGGLPIDRKKLHVAWFSASTLAYLGHLDVSRWVKEYGLGSGDLSGVAVRDGRLYVSEYQTDINPFVYSLPLEDGAPRAAGIEVYEIASRYANGIAFFGDFMAVSHDGTNDDGEALLDVYAVGDLSPDRPARPVATYRFEIGYTHGEGLTFYGDELWVADGPAVRRIENPLLPRADDRYEPNDTLAEAYDLSAVEGLWLRAVDGFAIQADVDWYRVAVEPGAANLVVEARFDATAEDVEIEVYDAFGAFVAESTGVSGMARLELINPDDGFYFVAVTGDNAGTVYDLFWRSDSAQMGPLESPERIEASDGRFADRVRLTWRDVEHELGYEVFRSDAIKGPYASVGMTEADVTFYDDVIACGSGTFYYKVVALYAAWEPPLSEADGGYTSPCRAQAWSGIKRIDTRITEELALAPASEPSLEEAPGIAPLSPLFGRAVSPVYRLGPKGAYPAPVAVQIPVPEGRRAEDLTVFYFSETPTHRGWYRGEDVEGWMAPGGMTTFEEDGQAFIQFEVHHSGVMQLGRAVDVQLGAMAPVSLGAEGSRRQWIAVVLTLIVLLALAAAPSRFRGRIS